MCSRIYLLTRLPECPADYEEIEKITVIAFSEAQARLLAQEKATKEEWQESIWTMPDSSRCRHIGDSIRPDALPEILSIQRRGVR